MPIQFPDVDDVTLEAPPLTEVICQVRFTSMLEISNQMPAEFQRRIRGAFPGFTPRTPVRIEITAGSAPPSIPLPNEFEFTSADGHTTVALGVEFVALSTKRYRHWQFFAGDLEMILGAFQEVYGYMQVTRIGLRYINVLNYDNTGTNTPDALVDFINSDLTHFFRNPMWHPPQNTTSVTIMRDNNEALALRIGIDMAARPQVILDYDYYTELGNPTVIPQNELLATLRRYHQRIYNAFRWSIPDRGFQAFRPIDREEE